MPHANLNSSNYSTGYDYANAVFEAVRHYLDEARVDATTPTDADDAFAALDDAVAAIDDTAASSQVDISSGSFWIRQDADGVRYLNDQELSISNRDYWDTLYANEVANPPAPVVVQDSTQEAVTTPEDPDANESNGEAVAAESEGNMQTDPAAAGMDITPRPPEDQRNRADKPVGQSILEDPNYHRVVNGWNQKLEASSQDLSSLVPFCELYAIFDQSDIIVKEELGSTRYTSIKDRMIQVKFSGPGQTEPALPQGLSENCSIVKVAGDNKSQLQSDSATIADDDTPTAYKSYKGVPGIGDLAVSRGSAAAQNVKYDLSITMPNPELINERFEYSKLMLMNSAFLIVYGWNIKDGVFNADYYPPTISKGVVNDVVIGNGIGGFWSAAVINLSNFNFSFDTVGHLVGKLTFLNSSGIFLGTLSTEAVGDTMEKQLTKPGDEVLRRVGGKENQNFIWANGVPWSATPPDAANAAENNTFAYRQEALTDYFNDEELTGGWSRAVEESLAGTTVTPAQAQTMKENIAELKKLGDKFLEDYRIAFINDLFWRKRSSQADSDLERSKLVELQDASTWKYLGTNWRNAQNADGRGREYGPGGDEGGTFEADEMVDTYFESHIRRAWNAFFLTRFIQSDIIAQGGGPIQGSETISIPLIDQSWPRNITAGSTLDRFVELVGKGLIAAASPEYGDEDSFGSATEISYQEPIGNRIILIPKLLEPFIVVDQPPTDAGADSYIKNMPPFGQDLQRKVVNDFKEPTNLNYNNFFSSNAKVVPNVLDLIKTTSVISVPVPVAEQDRLSLQVETRTYSDIFGIAPSDGTKADLDQVMIEFELLNTLPPAIGDTDKSYRDTLSKIIFHSTDVLYSLKNTTLGSWASAALGDFADADFFMNDASMGALRRKLDHVMIDENDPNYTNRYAQWKYAVLKNGWIVSQFQEAPGSGWVDRPPSPIINPATQTQTGLFFLTSLLSDESLIETGIESYITTLEQERDDAYTAWQALAADATGVAGKHSLYRAAVDKVTKFKSIVDLESSIIAAAEGSQMMSRRDMGTSAQDQLSTVDDTGKTVHTIMRQPVYFFLGSVLESLRVTTSDRVKFLYSEIVPRKTGEAFYINIPESSADSVQSTYDGQIANLERELVALGSTRNAASEEEPPPVMVADPNTPVDAKAKELLEAQKAWDDGLRDYIMHRGQDLADLWPPSKADQRPGGVYHSYTNFRGVSTSVLNRSPNYKWTDGPRLSYTWYDPAAWQGRTGGRLNVHAPWVYRIGNWDNYYQGPDKLYDIGNWEGSEGFMRLWRPEDLDAAIHAYDNGTDFYYRKSKDSISTSRPEAFATDSFGQRTGRVDYGYQHAWNSDGGDKDDRTSGFFDATVIERRGVLIQALLGWLNWYPADRETADRYDKLSTGSHRTFGRDGIGTAKWDGPNTMAEKNSESNEDNYNKAAGWYEIEWPRQRIGDPDTNWQPGSSAAGPFDKFFVKGLVVENFIALSAIRPNSENRAPVMGSSQSAEADRVDQISGLRDQIDTLEMMKKRGDLKAQFKSLPIRTTYEIPVNINTIRQFLTSEPRAPLHKLLKKIVGSAKETIPAIQLSMRPAASNPTYIDIFPSAMNYDGVIQEVFTEVDVNNSVDANDTMGIKSARKSINKGRLAQSEKVIVCQFGTAKSLVESFGLSSKIDPSAFSSFRLPAVVGGATMNVIDVLRSAKVNNEAAYADLLTDFGDILDKGLTTGMEGLKKLKIVGDGSEGSLKYDSVQLESFLLSEVPSISKAASSFIEDMMSQDVKLYNTILTMQSDFFTAKTQTEEGTTGDPGTRLAGSKFYGNVLSTFLRTANLTIHGTTGLSVFNLVYLKGLLSGIEGLYLISSVNESLAASTFTTTLECKLIEYTNNDPQTNPIAYRGASDLNRLASIIDETKARENKTFGTDYDIDRLGEFLEEVDTARGTLQ